ncbi:MAG: glycosyltransferase [Candidatus Magasanikbacteria bacterium]|nr:glycosyltransferase [Candidatus Magasanikbacteria bacterium]
MISLIATVYNEKLSFVTWLKSIQAQTKKPHEIIIVDGGSTDGTWELLGEESSRDPLIKIFQEKGNIAHGRNTAIRYAKGEYIVVADAGCLYALTWFEKITESLGKNHVQFATTAFGPWFKKGDSMIVYLIAASTIPMDKEFFRPWLASSRSVAFAKHMWQNVQGYPEWLPICEDIVFDLAVEKQGIKPVYIQETLVLWRPRLSFKEYGVQLFKYTKGDGHAGLFFARQMVRYVVYATSIILFILMFINYVYVIVLGVGIVLYMSKFWKRWLYFTRDKNILYRCVGILFMPFIIALGDIFKMCGWPVGVYDRYIGKIKSE